MTENSCSFGNRREELLLGYLYDELDAPERAGFDRHLAECGACRRELDGFETVRTHLASWTPPVIGRQASGASRQSWWQAIPVWAQVAAALLFLGVSAGIANLDVHYDQSGLTIRTGWSSHTPAANAAPAAAATAQPVPWRADLTALERQLRTELRQTQPATVAVTAARPAQADAETLRRVRALIDESERKQQRDLALRVAEVMHDVDNQRRTDLTRISQSLGQIQNNTGMEVMKQRQLLNYLVSVSQK